MDSGLPIRLDDLIRGAAVEDNRREFKKTWDDQVKSASLRTICAFANDLLNLNGGYIVLGIDEHEGKAILPPEGLDGLDDVSISLVRRFLAAVESALAERDAGADHRDLYRQMRVTVPINSHDAPRNVALLFFHEDPDKWFPGARIEIVQFASDGDLIEERVIKGPVDQQVREALNTSTD